MFSLLPLGSIFAGRYRVGRCIASGGMGAVHEVEHVETGRRAALKVMLPHVLSGEGSREQFKAEARVAAKLRSEHVVDVLDAGFDDETEMPFLVMELLDGEDLAARLRRLGPLPRADVVSYLVQVARALDRVHRSGIVHRDLKPENLFLTERDDGSPLVKVLDFGISKVLAQGATSALTVEARGTPVYMSPEQFTHEMKISPATDLYALGMVAYTLLTGSAYWADEIDRGMNVFLIARLAESGPREPATARAKARGVELPAAFDAWFSKITAVEPAERFARASEAVRALAQALDVDLPVPSDRPSSSGLDRPSSSGSSPRESAPPSAQTAEARSSGAPAPPHPTPVLGSRTTESQVTVARPREEGSPPQDGPSSAPGRVTVARVAREGGSEMTAVSGVALEPAHAARGRAPRGQVEERGDQRTDSNHEIQIQRLAAGADDADPRGRRRRGVNLRVALGALLIVGLVSAFGFFASRGRRSVHLGEDSGPLAESHASAPVAPAASPPMPISVAPSTVELPDPSASLTPTPSASASAKGPALPAPPASSASAKRPAAPAQSSSSSSTTASKKPRYTQD